ncbi:MAG: hypothetical protein ACXWGT_19795 [Usitatibacter sp.]
MRLLLPALAIAAFAASGAAVAQKTTVCTVTVNSADERDAFRKYLPGDKYEFVELVERGRSDWLASACRQQVQCDVLVVSGHFAGTEFYSSKFDVNESLPVDEIERAQCSASCPGLFSHLKEVYLFGCDTLKPEPVRSAMPEIVRGLVRTGEAQSEAERIAQALSARHGEASRDLMRRLFPQVPVIYGFSSLAPYGRVAGPLLAQYFEQGNGGDIGSGRASDALLRLFGPSSMTMTTGMSDADPDSDYRGESCRFYDDRLPRASKLASIHRTLAGPMPELRMGFDRIERFFGAISDADRGNEAFADELQALEKDRGARGRYLDIVRATEDPALRVRMIALARGMRWLDATEQRAELVHTIVDILAARDVGFGEVDLICTLNKDRALDPELPRLAGGATLANRTAREAARACLGSIEARARVLRALASPDDRDVSIAQAYLRHQPIVDSSELREVARGVTRMSRTAAQVRALETLARQRIEDRQILEELARLYTRANSVAVQRAIAEIFIRSGDVPARDIPDLPRTLRDHRLAAPGGGQDLIDVLLARFPEAAAR